MPQNKKPPRLWFNKGKGLWYILYAGKQHGTGCARNEAEQAEEKLAEFYQNTYRSTIGERDLNRINVADVINLYLDTKIQAVSDPKALIRRTENLNSFWGGRTLADVKGATCRAYVKAQNSVQSARRELEDLSAAMHLYHREYGLPVIPAVTKPEKSQPRERWLTRQEVARLLRAARANGHRHLCRFILISVYTGTRKSAVLDLQWHANTTGGYVDLEKGVMYRAGIRQKVASNKRRPPIRMNRKLLGHLKRWLASDMRPKVGKDGRPVAKKKGSEAHPRHVVHFRGKKVKSNVHRSWISALHGAGLGPEVVLHTLRHTAATWQMQAGTPIFEAAGYLGMNAQTLERVYGHHSPHHQENAANAY